VTAYFLDSSTLVKRYVTETGSSWVRSITTKSAGHTIFVAEIARVEVVSAFARRKRELSLSPRSARAAYLILLRHTKRDHEISLMTEEVMTLAETLLDKYVLRAADAIQLASAIEVHSRLTAAKLSGIIFVAGDNRLLTAATGEGLTVDNPNNYP
jgi:predicted nucleic acid-binding protein